MMDYYDSIYGRERFSEPVLIDLIRSDALQRLKGVLQHGISGMIGVTSPITRFEHSVGAMILVRRLGGSLKEQTAALLHDVSHTVFSHVIDYVFDGHDSQGYHDEKKEEHLAKTDVPRLLERHGYEWLDFVDETAYPLLEQPSPRLCADRLDYFLRDSIPLGLATDHEVQAALGELIVTHGRIGVKGLETARWMGYTFMEADESSWANFREVGLYELTARAIKRALHLGVVSESDFWLTDREVWGRLQAEQDPQLQSLLKLIAPATRFRWDEDRPTFRVSTKLRAIDPDVAVNGGLRPLSTLDQRFAQQRRAYLARKRGKWPMRVIPAA